MQYFVHFKRRKAESSRLFLLFILNVDKITGSLLRMERRATHEFGQDRINEQITSDVVLKTH